MSVDRNYKHQRTPNFHALAATYWLVAGAIPPIRNDDISIDFPLLGITSSLTMSSISDSDVIDRTKSRTYHLCPSRILSPSIHSPPPPSTPRHATHTIHEQDPVGSRARREYGHSMRIDVLIPCAAFHGNLIQDQTAGHYLDCVLSYH